MTTRERLYWVAGLVIFTACAYSLGLWIGGKQC